MACTPTGSVLSEPGYLVPACFPAGLARIGRIVTPGELRYPSAPCDTSSMYSPVLLDHFQHPRNAGDLPGAPAKVEVSNPVCGDVLQLAATFENGAIREIRFLCRGCTASIACASMLSESVQGRELSSLRTVTPESLASSLGGLPPASFHAAQLAHEAFQALLRAAQK